MSPEQEYDPRLRKLVKYSLRSSLKPIWHCLKLCNYFVPNLSRDFMASMIVPGIFSDCFFSGMMGDYSPPVLITGSRHK
jgi:hypothetical protein